MSSSCCPEIKSTGQVTRDMQSSLSQRLNDGDGDGDSDDGDGDGDSGDGDGDGDSGDGDGDGDGYTDGESV